MSDEITALMKRDHLRGLIHATGVPEVSAHTIPRVLVSRDASMLRHPADDELEAGPSPLLVLGVIGMLIALFIGIVQL